MTVLAGRPTAPLPPVEERAAMPAGFAAGATRAGIKPSGKPDLAVVAVTAPQPATAAGVFTQNLMAAAPVHLSRTHLAAGGGRCRGLVVTSGCANAATGPAGAADQAQLADLLAAALGCPAPQTLLAATGLIGSRLPMERLAPALIDLVPSGLTAGDTGLAAVAEAIMTTDTRVKVATTSLALPTDDGSVRQVRVSGLAKGVGMIHPDMATLIAVVLTDAAVPAELLAATLREVSGATFGQLSVDGDTSTNDSLLALASGVSDTLPLRPRSPDATAFAAAVEAVCRALARQQAADGEGATTLITCRVGGAADLIDARAVARAVVSSNLVKAAVRGRDPNWGRVASAAGAARRPDGMPVGLDPTQLSIALAGQAVFRAGGGLDLDRPMISAAMAVPEVVIELDLGLGPAWAEAWGCDLTEDYVRINAEYST